MGCVTDGTLTICFGPQMEVIKEEREDNRWCFGCRQRGGVWKLWASIEPSYYEPNWAYECDKCGHERIQFGF